MLISCPICQSRYLIPDNAIGPIGRPVRCGACKHSWMQLAPESRSAQKTYATTVAAHPKVESVQEVQSGVATSAESHSPDSDSKTSSPLFRRIDMPPLQGSAAASKSDAQSHAAVEEQEYIEDTMPPRNRRAPAEDWQEPSQAQEWMSSSRRRYRRDMTRYYSIAAIFGGLMLVGANVLLWKSDFTQSIGAPALLPGQSSPLQLQITEVPRAAFQPNGDIEQPITIRIDNPTERSQPIPRIRARMVDRNNQLVFAWTFQARQTHLPAGKSLSVRTRATNFPTDPLPVRLSLEFVDKAKS